MLDVAVVIVLIGAFLLVSGFAALTVRRLFRDPAGPSREG